MEKQKSLHVVLGWDEGREKQEHHSPNQTTTSLKVFHRQLLSSTKKVKMKSSPVLITTSSWLLQILCSTIHHTCLLASSEIDTLPALLLQPPR
jgi:hypothetical protein